MNLRCLRRQRTDPVWNNSTLARQRGFAAILVLLVLLSSAAFFLLRSLNEASHQHRAQETTTARALQIARDALLGYSVHYPEDHLNNPQEGPGQLPCPDLELDNVEPLGSADSCANSTGRQTGLLPWHTLKIEELRDGSGAPLWYTVSNNHRSNASGAIINSATPGTLGLDTCAAGGDDIVALIIAPGPALADQNRVTDFYHAGAYRDLIATYLEGKNADSTNTSPADECFSTLHDETHNDQVLAITRRELMNAVEHRVANDVVQALKRYRADPDGDDLNGADPDCPNTIPNCDDGYPWLAEFSDPVTSAYIGKVGTRHGLLPLRQLDVPFSAPFIANWEVPAGGSVAFRGVSGVLTDICIRSTNDPACQSKGQDLSGNISGALGDPWLEGTCKSTKPDSKSTTITLICTAHRNFTDTGGQVYERRYDFELTNLAYRIRAPTATTQRFQDFALNNVKLASDPPESIKISQTDCTFDAGTPCAETAPTFIGAVSLDLPPNSSITSFILSNVPFDLEVSEDGTIDPANRRSPGELPKWFVSNAWHHQFYLAYADSYAPGAGAVDCALPIDHCLEVKWNRTAPLPAVNLAKVSAVLINAREPLKSLGQVRASGSAITDYFEGANTSDGVKFEKRGITTDFNDDLLVIPP